MGPSEKMLLGNDSNPTPPGPSTSQRVSSRAGRGTTSKYDDYETMGGENQEIPDSQDGSVGY